MNWFQHTAALALSGRMRVVGLGLKVWVAAALDDRKGHIVAGRCTRALETSAGDYSTHGELLAAMMEYDTYECSPPDDGAQIRWQPSESTDGEFFDVDPAWGPTYGLAPLSCEPIAICNGFASGAAVYVSAIAHLEYMADSTSLIPTSPSPYGNRLALIQHMAGTAPVSASGHSFMSFLKMAAKVTKVAAQVASIVIPPAVAIAGMIA